MSWHLYMSVLAKRFAGFHLATGGAIAMNFALGAMALFGICGLGVNYAMYQRAYSDLQTATDAGALAAAKELGLVNIQTDNVQSIVEAVVNGYVAGNVSAAGQNGGPVVSTNVTMDPLEVNVMAFQTFEPLFDIGGFSARIEARSVARIVGQPNVCVLGLDPSEVGTISLEHHALVTGRDCAVFSNSSHTNAIKAKNDASLTADLICSRGGKSGGPGQFSPEPLTDCPAFDDPLADRPEPVPSACLETNLAISALTTTLSPGTYCGGLTLSAGARVELSAGIYIFKDGPLSVDGGSTLTGTSVGLFFTGAGAIANFAAASTIEIAAPEDGPMAGLLMFESRSQPTTGIFRITSDDARTLLGTIYLPRSELRIDANSPVADQSAYTAIVARAMRLYGGPHLILNTNYNSTTVPVPGGIKGTGQPIALVE